MRQFVYTLRIDVNEQNIVQDDAAGIDRAEFFPYSTDLLEKVYGLPSL